MTSKKIYPQPSQNEHATKLCLMHSKLKAESTHGMHIDSSLILLSPVIPYCICNCASPHSNICSAKTTYPIYFDR